MTNSWNRCFVEISIHDLSLNRAPPLSTKKTLAYGVLVPERARLIHEGFVRGFQGPSVTNSVSWYIIMRWCKRHTMEPRFIIRYLDEPDEKVRRAILFREERNARIFARQWVRRYPLD